MKLKAIERHAPLNTVQMPVLLLPCPSLEHGTAGHCPACHKPVDFDDEDGPVWTCPMNLSKTNPHWMPSLDWIDQELMDRWGVYSHCPKDFGGHCSLEMPLHGACYNGLMVDGKEVSW